MDEPQCNPPAQQIGTQANAQPASAEAQSVSASPSVFGHVEVKTVEGGIVAGIYIGQQTINNPAPIQSTLAVLGRIHGNLPPLSAAFTGRDEILQAIHTTLNNDNAALTPPRAALQGLGGIGKTQTALAYLIQHQNDYADLFWAVGETPEQLAAQLAAFAPGLDPPVPVLADQNATLQQVRQWFATHDNWLLVIDNAENLSRLTAVLPPLNKGRLLLTTRDVAMSGLANRIEVDRLDEENGALLLLRRADPTKTNTRLVDFTPQQQADARAISRDVDGLPLALDQAGAYIETRQITPARYRELYQHRRETLHRAYDNADHASVAMTFALALKQVEEDAEFGAAAAELVRVCALLAPSNIPDALFITGAAQLNEPLATLAADEVDFADVYAVACRYALLRHDADPSGLRMHRMAQEVVRDSLSAEERWKMEQSVRKAVYVSFPKPEFPVWSFCERLLPHALRCCEYLITPFSPQPEALWLLTSAASYLRRRARYAEAEPLLNQSLIICRTGQGVQLTLIATVLNDLAVLYTETERYKDAVPLMKEALAIGRQTIGEAHPDYATGLDNLASVYSVLGRYEEAETLHKQALDITERVQGAEHPNVARRLNNLANLYINMERNAEAETLLLRVLTIDRTTLSADDPAHIVHLTNLGRLYLQWNRIDEAKPLLEEALAASEQAGEKQSAIVANCHYWVGALRALQDDQTGAATHLRMALAFYEAQFGSNNPYTVSTRNLLASIKQD